MNTEEKLVQGLKLIVEAFAEMIKDNKSEVAATTKKFERVNTGLPRMRTIKGLVEEIKAIDPTTKVNEYYVRQLVKQNKIKYSVVGTKSLINLDMFLDYLENPPKEEKIEETNLYGTIRKVEENLRKRR